MKIVFAVLPGYGHVYPVMPLARACATAGHDVVMAAGPPFLQRLPGRPVNQFPEGLDLGWAASETSRRRPVPGAIADAVEAMLSPGPEHAAAQRIRSDIGALPAPADVVPMLVDFAQRR